jgi:plastocyanin
VSSSTTRRAALLLLATALTALAMGALGGTATAGGSKTAVVSVVDDFYTPTSQAIRKGDKVKWKWASTNTDSHNVTLKQAPNGIDKRDYKSGTATAFYRFVKRFPKPGNYHFICTIHPDLMQFDLRVKH